MADGDGTSAALQDDHERSVREIAELGVTERPSSADRLIHDLEDQVWVSIGEGASSNAAVASLLVNRVEQVIDMAPEPVADELRQALVRRAFEVERDGDGLGRELADAMARDEKGRYPADRVRRAERDLELGEEAVAQRDVRQHRHEGLNRIEATDGTASEQAGQQIQEFVELVGEPTHVAVASDNTGLLARIRGLVSGREADAVGADPPGDDETTIPEALRRRYGVHVSEGQKKIELFENGARAAAITLDSRSISTRHNEGTVIADVVALARDRGWQSLKVAGTPEFKDAIWLEANKVGLAVSHRPSSAMQAAFDKWDRDRPENKIQQGAVSQWKATTGPDREDLGALFAARSPEERLADPRLRNAHLELMLGIRTAEKELGRSVGEMPDVHKALTAAVGQQLASGRVIEAPFVRPEQARPAAKQVANPKIEADKIASARQ